jgi:uncharacterized protein (DUF1684 family)
MKIWAVLILILAIAACNSPNKWETKTEFTSFDLKEQSPYSQKVLRYRDSMDAVFYSGSNKILPKEAIATDGKLNYFLPDESYRVQAQFIPIKNGEVFKMKTNTDRLPEYRKYGKLSFTIQNQNLVLTLYQNLEQPEYLFCPFKDKTNGKQSYGAGRFLDFEKKDLVNMVLDFNYAYNPYCAYNSNFSCPLPPLENHLEIAVMAGEKAWH